MTDGPDYAAPHRGADAENGSDTLASRVVSVIASRLSKLKTGADEGFVRRLCNAVQSNDPMDLVRLAADMREAGISKTAIADLYVPVAARRMGNAWCEDEMSFADVTIGTARLQSMLRDLGGVWSGDRDTVSDAPTVLMIVAADEYHTLGALVATGQMRRAGMSVRLSIGNMQSGILDLVETFDFDAIMISGSHGEKLKSLRKLIVNVRHALPKPTPIVLGGVVLELANDVKTITGADHVTDDPQEALRLCGLRARTDSAPWRAAKV